MIVIFSSQCQKNAIAKTSRVLDSFANRIGTSTWKTVITQEGLLAVKKLLRKTASKNTAVACHVIHGRSSMELLWIVGKRNCFNKEGIIPVALTQNKILSTSWENDWNFHPLIQALVALSALFHDVGKANKAFQKKLIARSKTVQDPLRHEWVSCLIVVALVRQGGNSDIGFLGLLENNAYSIPALMTTIEGIGKEESPFQDIPDFCFYIIWLILGHHKLAKGADAAEWKTYHLSDLNSFKKMLKNNWGYCSEELPTKGLLFPQGLVLGSKAWAAQTSKWAKKAIATLPLFNDALEAQTFRPILLYSRLCLMFGDHSFSSTGADENWKDPLGLYANTDSEKKLKQHLDEHILGVQREALAMAYLLPRFETDLEYAEDVRSLTKKSLPGSFFFWQDRATNAIQSWKRDSFADNPDPQYGFFAVNMASTGCGKTVANAKIMQTLSKDGQSLRFVLSLGLRTLTLQTGDEYRDRIGLDSTELAVLIGSRAVETLHGQQDEQSGSGSESIESLLQGDVEYESAIPESKLSIIMKDDKSRKLLYSPVLSCTIDYMMQATEVVRGGRWMLPFLRMMSSDLVIDEIDDFTGSDLIAIGRLIHLAGMLGRKVMISSATIPPDLAEGYFRTYKDGWCMYARSRNIPMNLGCAWVDEFTSLVVSDKEPLIEKACIAYRDKHSEFVAKRIQKIEKDEAKNGIRRKGRIVRCEHLTRPDSDFPKEKAYFETIKNEAISLHTSHSYPDPETGINVSFGCIRVANIQPCINLFEYLLSASYPADIEVRIMPYHSRQVLILRSAQEKHLDTVLKCKSQDRSEAFSNPIIRKHLYQTGKKHLIFILVCTPVEEVGRDHDFDWSIIEPSSYRSIIQLAGRVRRHRSGSVESANISVMQFNLKGLEESNSPVFLRPGFETPKYMLKSHDVANLVDVQRLEKSINAYPRICKNNPLRPDSSLVDLEHSTMERLLTAYSQHGPETLEGWLGSPLWSLSALPQKLSPFRHSDMPMQQVFLYFDGENEPVFGIFEKFFISKMRMLDIHIETISQELLHKLWIERDYVQLLLEQKERTGESFLSTSMKYGEILIPENSSGFIYSDHFGMKTLSYQ